MGDVHGSAFKATNTVGVSHVGGDVVGVRVGDSGNIIGKTIQMSGYTQIGGIVNLHLSDGEIITVPTQIDQSNLSKSSRYIKDRLAELENIQRQIKSILEEVSKIEKIEGTQILEIKAENIQISKNELSIKELLKGNEYLYR
jgi:hypothetical protein